MPAPLPDPHSEAVLSRAVPPPDRTHSYGPDPAQVYDVRLPHSPSSGPVIHRVTVLLVHGGFWRAADDRTHAGAAAQALAGAGFHVAVGEYRRSGMPGGGVPGTLEDVTALVAAVTHDPRLPRRLVLVGHSAGGHLVAWAANHAWAARSVGVLALGGCLDLAATDRLGLGANAARDFLGGGPEEAPAAWTLADPVTSLPPRVPV
ncbi:MAG: alpha/beta fold hydrolase, partial [Micrococcales bacterium]|nr:alpha/beta fold hydrolase [Micrococcales bacterium]